MYGVNVDFLFELVYILRVKSPSFSKRGPQTGPKALKITFRSKILEFQEIFHLHRAATWLTRCIAHTILRRYISYRYLFSLSFSVHLVTHEVTRMMQQTSKRNISSVDNAEKNRPGIITWFCSGRSGDAELLAQESVVIMGDEGRRDASERDAVSG